MGAEYPCWVYDPSGINPPIYVTSDDAYVALLTATPSGAGAQMPVPATSAKVSGVTTAPPAPQWTKGPGKPQKNGKKN